eukprot:COSAG02_NODE_37079_length_446_cov_1.489914_1_plen_123_part_01
MMIHQSTKLEAVGVTQVDLPTSLVGVTGPDRPRTTTRKTTGTNTTPIVQMRRVEPGTCEAATAGNRRMLVTARWNAAGEATRARDVPGLHQGGKMSRVRLPEHEGLRRWLQKQFKRAAVDFCF